MSPTVDVHILNGDSLAMEFAKTGLPGGVCVFRECLVVGPVSAVSREEFWTERAEFLTAAYGGNGQDYQRAVVAELTGLDRVGDAPSIAVWFEDDLFCQVNLWFVLGWLREHHPASQVQRVFPPMATGWAGFGPAPAPALQTCFAERVPFAPDDLDLGVALWEAYRSDDSERLTWLSTQSSPCFRKLDEVVAAQVARAPAADGLGRPQRALREIMANGSGAFDEVLAEFGRREGVYGFGDLQVRSLLATL